MSTISPFLPNVWLSELMFFTKKLLVPLQIAFSMVCSGRYLAVTAYGVGLDYLRLHVLTYPRSTGVQYVCWIASRRYLEAIQV